MTTNKKKDKCELSCSYHQFEAEPEHYCYHGFCIKRCEYCENETKPKKKAYTIEQLEKLFNDYWHVTMERRLRATTADFRDATGVFADFIAYLKEINHDHQ